MKYLTVRETAEKWGVDISLVRRFCKQDRLPGALRTKDGWLIPEGAVRPVRTRLKHTEEEVLPELAKTENGRRLTGAISWCTMIGLILPH